MRVLTLYGHGGVTVRRSGTSVDVPHRRRRLPSTWLPCRLFTWRGCVVRTVDVSFGPLLRRSEVVRTWQGSWRAWTTVGGDGEAAGWASWMMVVVGRKEG